MSNYATVSELKLFKIGTAIVNLSMFSTTELQDALDLAEEIIEKVMGKTFYSTTATHYFDGSGYTRQFFYPDVVDPLLSATSVVRVDDDDTTLYTFTENIDFKAYPYYLELISLVSTRYATEASWARGVKNIKITGSWGMSSTPKAIVKATKLLALEKLIPGSTNSTRIGIDSINWAEWDDFTIRFKPAAGEGDLTGIAEVDVLLKDYVLDPTLFLCVPIEKQLYESV